MKENLFLLKYLLEHESKIYKYMTSISKNLHIEKLDDIVNKYNITYHSTIKMKPDDVKPGTYIYSSKEINNEDPKFKIGNILRLSKYKNIFAKGYVPNWPEEVFVVKMFKNTVTWTYVISDLKIEEIVGTFDKKELQKSNQKEFTDEKSIKRKGDKLYVKGKGYDSYFKT